MTEYWLDFLENTIIEIKFCLIGFTIGGLAGYIRGRYEERKDKDEQRGVNL